MPEYRSSREYAVLIQTKYTVHFVTVLFTESSHNIVVPSKFQLVCLHVRGHVQLILCYFGSFSQSLPGGLNSEDLRCVITQTANFI